jgi:mannose-1-phosphate guanylyltransferase
VQALILAGGEGTRLRPLTYTVPKPVLPLAGRPHIAYVIDWLVRHGVDDVIISCGFLAEGIRATLAGMEPGAEIRYAEEPDPRGTAGAIRFAEDMLADRFLVLNGDILCDLDLTALVEQHESTGARATIALYPVADPTGYGLIHRHEDGEVTEFLEKPEPDQIDTDEINAGTYVIERAALDLIPPGRAVSIEREVFPRLVGQGLYGRRLDGYWMDIGTPERYLQASWDILEGTVHTELAGDGGPYIAAGCDIADDAALASRAVVCAGCEVGPGASVTESVMLDNCRIGAGAEIFGSILGLGVEVGDGARVGPGAVIGAEAKIASGAAVGADARVAPGESIEAEVTA